MTAQTTTRARRWTAADIPDLGGRAAVVTGANSGLGFHTALELARHGARVMLACRDEGRGADAVHRIRDRAPQARVEVGGLDLADLASVRRFAQAYGSVHDGLDVLVNNAGVMAVPYRLTVDGFEAQLGTNYLGHFALTGLLLPALLARPGARVVTVSSQMHRSGRIHFDDLHGERRYRKWSAYAQSKLADLLFAFEVARRAEAAHVALVSVAAHPGYAATNLQLAGPRLARNPLAEKGFTLANRLFGQPDAQGALPSLYAATAPDVRGGEYFGPDGPFEQRGYPKRVGASKAARDERTAQRLWEVSERLTGVRYEALPPP